MPINSGRQTLFFIVCGQTVMAKRANPYNEDFMPQNKVHIGIKQFNKSEERIKKVYEKTLELLFTGARKPTVNNVLENPIVTCSRKDTLKQLFIGKNGVLLHSGEMVTADNPMSAQCSCGGAVESKCAYCEKSLCTECQHHCTQCDHFCCSRCSLIGSEGSEVCVSCYD